MREWSGVVLAGMVLAVGCDSDRFGWGRSSSQPTKAAETQPSPVVHLTAPGVLALVGSTPITVEAFKRRVEALPDDDPRGFMETFGTARAIYRKPRTTEERRILVEELLKEELVVQDAVALGLERDPETKRQLEEARRVVLLNAVTRRYTEPATVTDPDIEAHYKQFQAVYKEPERIRVRQIVVASLPEAEALRATAAQGVDVAQLAREHSIGAGSAQGGDVGWYVRELDRQLMTLGGREPNASVFFPQLEPVVFALEVGQISQPVKGPDGHYSLVTVEERIPEKPQPLSELWDQIRAGLLVQKQQQTFQDRLDQLWKKAKIEFNEARLGQL